MLSVSFRVASLLLVWASGTAALQAQEGAAWIYFARGAAISKVRPDGTGLAVVRPGSGAPAGLALDEGAGRVYWGDRDLGTLQSVRLDGTDYQSHELPPGAGPTSLATSDGAIYWTDVRLGGVWTLQLGGSESAPSARQLAPPSYPAPSMLAAVGGEVFFAARGANRIQRVSGEGDLEEEFLWLDGELGDHLAIDAGRPCWLEDGALRCGRSTEATRTLIPAGPASDGSAGVVAMATHGDTELVWAEAAGVREPPVLLRGASAGGGGARLLGMSRQWVLALAASAEHVYWLDREGVHRAELRPRTNPPALHKTLYRLPSLPIQTLQVHAGNLYWIEGQGNRARIVRSALDASDEQVLLEDPGAHSLAIAGDRLYWSVAARNREELRTAALDGSNPRTLKQGHVASAGAVAATAGAVFQVDRVFDKILRTDTNGDGLEWIKQQSAESQRFFSRALAPQPDLPQQIALSETHLYWTVWNNDKIVRQALAPAGGPVEDLLTDRDVGGGMVYHRASQRLFWVESNPWSIWMLQLGGEGGERVRAPQQIVQRSYPQEIAVMGEWLVWNEVDTSGPLVLASLYRCRIEDCEAEQIVDADAIGGPGNTFDKRRRELVVPSASSLVAARGKLYWTEHESGRLVSSAIDGSGLRVLREGLGPRDQISAAGDALFLHRPDQDRVERLWLAESGELAGAPEVVAQAEINTESFAVANGWFYFVDGADDAIARLSVDPESAAAEVLWAARPVAQQSAGEASSLPASISSLAERHGRLYWTEHTAGRVVSSTHDGGDVRVHATGAPIPGSVAATEASVFWSQAQGIHAVRLAGGEPRVVLELPNVAAIAVEQ